MQLVLDFPTTGEPHYAESIPAEMVMPNSVRKFISWKKTNTHMLALGEGQAKVERKGNQKFMCI
jgi:nitrous-oxide reductase